jgi:nucleoside-diphosphate-sugar epimerase
MRRVLITGAGGFVGSHCATYAAAAGLEPYLVDKPGAGKAPSDGYFYADLLNTKSVTQLVRDIRPTLLLHLAWITRHNEFWTSAENEIWVESSYHLLKTFGQFGGHRAVLVGTCAEYDWRRAGVCNEFSTPVEPQTAYGRAKDRLRREAAEHASDVGMSLAWARLFFLYGPRENPNRLIPWVIRHLLAGEPADCTPGTQIRDLLYVSDVAEAVISLLLSSVTGPVNIGSGHPTTLRDAVTQTAEIIGRPDLLRFGARPMPAGEPPRLVADTGRLNNEVHWRPRVSLRDGLLETVAYWKLRGEPPGVTPGQSNRTS